MVHNLFCMSAAVASLCRAPPTYQYFCYVWNRDCSNIKLKRAMRFTKCDVCTACNEALDVERKKGGLGWMTEDMQKIKRTLEDHYEVTVVFHLCSNGEQQYIPFVESSMGNGLGSLSRSGSTVYPLFFARRCVCPVPLLFAYLLGRQTIESGIHDGEAHCLHQPPSSSLHRHRWRRPVSLFDAVLLPRDQRHSEGLEDAAQAHRLPRVWPHVHVLHHGF